MNYQPTVYQFQITVLVAGSIVEQYTRRLTQCEAWRWGNEESDRLAQMYADWRLRVECVA